MPWLLIDFGIGYSLLTALLLASVLITDRQGLPMPPRACRRVPRPR